MAEGVKVYRVWTVKQLKRFLCQQRIPLTGKKEEVSPQYCSNRQFRRIQSCTVPLRQIPGFIELPNESWSEDGFQRLKVIDYLKASYWLFITCFDIANCIKNNVVVFQQPANGKIW